MKKYIKPTLDVETYELKDVISLSKHDANNTNLHDYDTTDWNEFWG